MSYPLTIRCPPMTVRNTSRWNPWADREAEELVCDVDTFDRDGRPLAFKIVFPPVRIRRATDPEIIADVVQRYALASTPSAVWMVDSVLAENPPDQEVQASVFYPPEPTVRGPLIQGGLIAVLPVNSISGFVTWQGRSGRVQSTLPRTTGRPVGWGLRAYVVDACTCEGTVDWE